MLKLVNNFGALILGTLALAGCTTAPKDNLEYQNALTETAYVCASCALVGNDLLMALNKSCDTPITPVSFNSVMNSNPMFAAMMAINTIGGSDLYQVYRDAAFETLQCSDMENWPKRTIERFKQPDMEQTLILKVAQTQQLAH